jgi:hypothetical protein
MISLRDGYVPLFISGFPISRIASPDGLRAS